MFSTNALLSAGPAESTMDDYNIDTDRTQVFESMSLTKEPKRLPLKDNISVTMPEKDINQWNQLPKILARNKQELRVGTTGFLYRVYQDQNGIVEIVGQIQNYDPSNQPKEAIILWTTKFVKESDTSSESSGSLRGGRGTQSLLTISSNYATDTKPSLYDNYDSYTNTTSSTIESDIIKEPFLTSMENTQEIFRDFSLDTKSSMPSLSAEHS